MDATHSTVVGQFISNKIKMAVVWTQEVKCKHACCANLSQLYLISAQVLSELPSYLY